MRRAAGRDWRGYHRSASVLEQRFRGIFRIVGRTPNPGEPTPVVGQRKATPGLLETLGVPLLRGRYFETKDDLGTPLVAIVNDQLVKKYFPKEDPIGLKIVCPNGTGCEIIGVVGSVKHRDLAAEPNGGIYFAGCNNRRRDSVWRCAQRAIR
jgi:hypothetical protein